LVAKLDHIDATVKKQVGILPKVKK